jgi:hypothetical protein
VRAPSQASRDRAGPFSLGALPCPPGPPCGRRQRRRASPLLPTLLLVLVACNCRPDAPSAPPRNGPAADATGTVTVFVPPAAPSGQAAESGAATYDTPPRGSPFPVRMLEIGRQGELEIIIKYPELSAPAAGPEQAKAAKALSSAIATLAQRRNDEFAGYAEDSRKGIARGAPAWYLHRLCQILLNTPGLVSMACGEESYTGGAHGNALTTGWTFAVAQGEVRELSLDAFFVKPAKARERLSTLTLELLRKEGAQYVVDGTLKDLRAELKSFALTPEGLRFFFAPYSVGPYVQGELTVLVPYVEVAPLLPPKSLLEPLLAPTPVPPPAATAAPSAVPRP